MSHKSGHIIIQSKSVGSPNDPGVQLAEVQINFLPGTSLEERIKQVRHAMKVIDKLDHDDED